MKRFVMAMTVAVGLGAPDVAHAAIQFQYVTDAASYTGGGPVNVSVFLQETDSGGSTLFGNPSNKGLASYGVYVSQTSGTGGSTINSFTTAGQFNGFGTSQSVPVTQANANSSSSGSLPANSIDYFNSVPAGTTTNAATLVSGSAGNGVYKILVGTLQVTAGALTTFSLTSIYNSPGDGANAGGDAAFTLPAGSGSYSLDRSQTASGASGTQTYIGASNFNQSFTVSTAAAIPEPSSMLLCGLAASLGYFRLRRRKTADVVNVAVAV